MKYGRITIYFFSIVGVSIAQLSLIKALPGWLNLINLSVISMVFILGLRGLDAAAVWTLSIGLMMDILSFSPFGANLLNLSVLLVLEYFLLTYVFTNRSLYSFLAMVAIAIIANSFFAKIIMYIFSLAGFEEPAFAFLAVDFWLQKIIEIAVNLAAVTLLFNVLNFASNRIRPVFLSRK